MPIFAKDGEHWGDQIKKSRQFQCLSRNQLARLTGVSAKTIGRYEGSRRRPFSYTAIEFEEKFLKLCLR